jgi:hypothetical protein
MSVFPQKKRYRTPDSTSQQQVICLEQLSQGKFDHESRRETSLTLHTPRQGFSHDRYFLAEANSSSAFSAAFDCFGIGSSFNTWVYCSFASSRLPSLYAASASAKCA